ncbi:LuxR family transcriptional regulator [Pseudoduganella sp. FT26W]|uniref:LuxR family transcriptional regulator n=1 Tax=Duganella aquatilis TaxID=2666082 RepID=A0A844CSW6_9BURK|nr:HD domain-containing phosphohydrolase [Duganella aquatilis]MRW83403.1 LuxR family transcriptional regulator [Duganella aquatilis]
MHPDTTTPITDAVRTLAYVGDLSMGQPTEHSLRTAWLAARIAEAVGGAGADTSAVQHAALLRWSGCTANAPEFSALVGDDVGMRAGLLAHRLDDPAVVHAAGQLHRDRRPLSQIHCEVSGEIACMLRLSPDVENALRAIFATYDGSGPNHSRLRTVPDSVYMVALASDVEILSRDGLPRALEIIAHQSGKTYPAELAALVSRHAAGWLEALDGDDDWQAALDLGASVAGGSVPLELLADVIDLKLPWMTGYSRRVALAARDGAASMGLDMAAQQSCYRAALLHGIGRAAVPNSVWNTSGKLSLAAREKLRLAPYWTSRAAACIGSLARDAEIGSYAGERLDGSGAFRACAGAAMPVEGKIVAAASAWIALQSQRPWRAALAAGDASALLAEEAAAGRFDADAVRAVSGAMQAAPPSEKILLTERETAIFRRISLGLTNKEVARDLDISPSTVRTHVENVFRKLGCSTRAAATLKAATLRLL